MIMGNLSLFDIGVEFYALNELVNEIDFDEETGEIIDNTDLIEQLFMDVAGELSYKLDNTMYIIKETEGKADLIGKEIKRLQAKKKAMENKATRLRELMLNAIKVAGQEKIKTVAHSFSIRKSKAVNIINEDVISREFMRIKREVDKSKIKKVLADGGSVEGATLVENESLGVR
jgi:hypothetical protein